MRLRIDSSVSREVLVFRVAVLVPVFMKIDRDRCFRWLESGNGLRTQVKTGADHAMLTRMVTKFDGVAEPESEYALRSITSRSTVRHGGLSASRTKSQKIKELDIASDYRSDADTQVICSTKRCRLRPRLIVFDLR